MPFSEIKIDDTQPVNDILPLCPEKLFGCFSCMFKEGMANPGP